jgi:hypothetical protein
MIFEVQCIPPAIAVHEGLPLVDNALEVLHYSFTRRELPFVAVIHIHTKHR